MDIFENELKTIQNLAKGCELLVVEDDSDFLESLQNFFKKIFLKVYIANDAETAMAIYKHRQHSEIDLLIITDINLGTMSGIDLAANIKSEYPNQKIIAISGTDNRDVFVDAIRCGVDRFILKPINFRLMFDALKSLLEEIAQKKELEKSQKQLEESQLYTLQLLKEQDEFLKNAIHEMHTPLSVIITNIDLIRMNDIDCESLDAIEAASRTIQNSYQDMAYLMKRNHERKQKSIIDVKTFIKERIQYFMCIAHVNDITLTLNIDNFEIPNLYMSEIKLYRIIDNTLSNAIKYSFHPSDVKIDIGLTDHGLCFSFNNKGPVIQSKEKIFERFYREEKHKGGYGLGLNIVAQICKEESIDIEIDSTLKDGTTFRYFFPENLVISDIPKGSL